MVTVVMEPALTFQVNMNESNNHEEIKEISDTYKIFEEIYINAPPFLKDLSDSSVDTDYTEFIHDKIDFKKINIKFINGDYYSITDIVKDIRTVFINCYTFYGSRSYHTKKSLKLEALLEKKICCLEKNSRLLADVSLTFRLLKMDGIPRSKLRYPKGCYDSILLRSVAHCRPERLKEYHRTLSTKFITDEANVHILEKIFIWENEVYFNDIYDQYISSMWELPEIGCFVAIIFKKLNLGIISQGEIERMFLWPEKSTTMGKIMTILLMPDNANELMFFGEIMPYEVWSEKLSCKISEWCKVYYAENKNKVNVMNSLGIHSDFWAIVNEKNPLIEKDYCELSYVIKVWLLKGLCDYVTTKFETLNDIVKNCNERKCIIWNDNLETEEYFFFDSMSDFRIYYKNIPNDQPSLEFLESVKPNKEVEVKDIISAKQKENHFKLIADSVEGLRSFLDELDVEGSSVPEDLINALEELIIRIEPEEHNIITLNNEFKLKMFKEWSSYSDRNKKDLADNISLSTEKDQKSSRVQKKGLIIEKHCRKSTIQQEFESDEFFTENDNLSITDFTDSISLLEEKDSKLKTRDENKEITLKKDSRKLAVHQDFENDNYISRTSKTIYGDNWVAMNKPKNKNKRSFQSMSKHVTLERQFLEDGKMTNNDTNNQFDANKNDKSICLVKLENTGNEVKSSNNTYNHYHNKKSVHSSVGSDREIVSFDSRKDANKNLPNNFKNVEVINLEGDMQNDCETVNNNLETTKYNGAEDKKKKTSIISIEDDAMVITDDEIIVLSDDENDVQFVLTTSKAMSSPLKINNYFNLSKSYNSVSAYKQTTLTKRQATSPIIPRISQNMPANVHVPKGIEMTMNKSPKTNITSHFNSIKKRKSNVITWPSTQ